MSLRLSNIELEQFKAAGARFGMSASEWLRAVGMKSLLVDPREPDEQHGG